MGENDLPDLGMNVLDLLQQKLNARFSELVFRLIHGRYAAEKVFALRHVVKADDRDILLSADLTGERLRERLGERETARLFSECDAIALVNWAEMPQATDLWRGVPSRLSGRRAAHLRRRGRYVQRRVPLGGLYGPFAV